MCEWYRMSALNPTLEIFNSEVTASDIYPELPDKNTLTNEMEAWMWL